MQDKLSKFEKAALLLLMLLAGIFGGLIRYFHLKYGFDALGLAVRGNRHAVILAALFALITMAFAVVIVLALTGRLFPKDAVSVGTIGTPTILLSALSALAAAVGTIVTLVSAVKQLSVWGMLNGILFFAAAILTVPVVRKLSARSDSGSPIGTASLIIVFWSCFRLIEVYRTVSSTPSVSVYFYDLAALISLILMFFSCAGYLYGRSGAMRVYLTVAAYLFFGTVSLVGKGGLCLSALFSGAPVVMADATDVCVYLYGFLFALAVIPTFFAPRRADPVAELIQAAAEPEENSGGEPPVI